MNLGDQLITFFSSVGSLVCHQLPERSLWVDGYYLSVCARCTGIYLGFYIGYSVLHFRNTKSKGPPNLLVTLSMVLPIVVDGTGQWLGFWTSTNSVRLFTGLLFGTSIAPFLIYLLSMLPTAKKLLLIKNILPNQTELDDLGNPWPYSSSAPPTTPDRRRTSR